MLAGSMRLCILEVAMSNTSKIEITQRDDSIVSLVRTSAMGSVTRIEVGEGIDFSVLGASGDWSTQLQDAVENLERLIVQFSGCVVRIERADDGKI
jgi:hypothetical protein